MGGGRWSFVVGAPAVALGAVRGVLLGNELLEEGAAGGSHLAGVGVNAVALAEIHRELPWDGDAIAALPDDGQEQSPCGWLWSSRPAAPYRRHCMPSASCSGRASTGIGSSGAETMAVSSPLGDRLGYPRWRKSSGWRRPRSRPGGGI